MQSRSQIRSESSKAPNKSGPMNVTRIYRQPCSQRLSNDKLQTYLFEVHDFLDSKTYGDRFWANIRDITGQRALEVPYSMMLPIIEHLMSCKVDDAELEHDEDDEKALNPPVTTPGIAETQFDIANLENKRIFGLDRSFALEISDLPDDIKYEGSSIKFLTCESLIEDEKPDAGGDGNKVATNTDLQERRDFLKPRSKKGSLVITEWLLPRLVLFLRDVSVRHKSFPNGYPSVRNLYTPSGSRRFFFDINETHWGSRLQISQVTTQHRNTISLPLENLVLFRNRLNRLIKQLDIDEDTDIRIARSPRPRKVPVNGVSPRRGRRPFRYNRFHGTRRFKTNGPTRTQVKAVAES